MRQGRDVQHLRPGDAILVDAARPYELHFPAGVHCVSVQMGSLLAAAMEPCEWDRPPPSDDLHAQACAWLKEPLSDPGLRVDDLSQALGVPLRSLLRLFAHRGATVTTTLKALRMQQAQAMLSQARLRHLPMGEVAQRCGYSAPSHFGRDFLRSVGLSPARWRAQRLR